MHSPLMFVHRERPLPLGGAMRAELYVLTFSNVLPCVCVCIYLYLLLFLLLRGFVTTQAVYNSPHPCVLTVRHSQLQACKDAWLWLGKQAADAIMSLRHCHWTLCNNKRR